MVGRLDDWLKVLHDKQNLSVDPAIWSGPALLFSRRLPDLSSPRLSSAPSLRGLSQSHALERIHRGDVVISPPCVWQKRYNESDIEIVNRIDTPVDPRIVETLLSKFPDFARAYNENGLTPAEFDTFGSTRRTLRGFIAAVAEMTPSSAT